MKNSNYKTFFLMILISFGVMYFAMFLNVSDISHVYLSLTRFYMALLMVCPMAILMVVMMNHMYMDKKLNQIIIISSCLIFFIALFLLRTQAFVSDEQYLKAMISHHSSAILASENANLINPEVKNLSISIIQAQEYEIDLMKSILGQKS